MKKILLLLVFLVLVFGATVQAREREERPDNFDEILAQIREEVFAPTIGPMMYTPQVFIDTTGIPHTPPKHLHDWLIPAEDEIEIEPFFTPSPYTQGATRIVRLWDGRGGTATATLRLQGARVNIWTVGTSLPVTPAMRDRFDQIVNRMTGTSLPPRGYSFAPFAGVRVQAPFSNQPLVGDIHGDGRINVLLHNHTSGGFFTNGDYFIRDGHGNLLPGRPLPMIHVSSNFATPGHPRHCLDTLYNIFAHELQHLLFHLHIAVYMTRDVDDEFLWFNEALSELAGFLYANPGRETIDLGRNFDAAINSYAAGPEREFGDFLHFNRSLKSYGMARLYAIHLERNQRGVALRVFNYLRRPPSQNSAQFNANQAWVERYFMPMTVGNALQSAGLTGPTGAGGDAAFDAIYFLFMENFAADGGRVRPLVGAAHMTTRFMNSDFAAHRLWGIRPNLGTTGRLYVDATTNSWNTVSTHAALPTLTTGGRVTLSGFNGSSPTGWAATHESFHLLGGRTAGNDLLNITINDNHRDTRYYVVVPNTHLHGTAVPGNRTFGQHGAEVHQITANGQPNRIQTYGRPAYLFVATLFRNVNTPVTFSWQVSAPPATHAISFNSNGGTGTMAAGSVQHGSNFTIPANVFTRANHEFAGWNTAANGTGRAFAAGGTITNVTAPMTLFAQWRLINRTVTFNANGGDGTMPTGSVPHGTAFRIPANVFTRANYDFTGWNTAANGTGTAFAAGATIPSVTANMTLFAQWRSINRTVTFNANGGTGTMDDGSVPHGGAFTIPPLAFTRPAHTFDGWNTAANGTGTVFAAGATIPSVTANTTLYAQWIPYRTVTFNANSGTGTMDDGSVPHGTAFTIPPLAFTRPAHTFDGWNTAANGTGTAFADGATIPSVTANTTLFAQWIPYRTITLAPNGGTGWFVTPAQPDGSDFVLPVAVPHTWRGHGFGHGFTGWTLTRDGSGHVFQPGDEISNVTENMTLFAQWGLSVEVDSPRPDRAPPRVRIPYRRAGTIEITVRLPEALRGIDKIPIINAGDPPPPGPHVIFNPDLPPGLNVRAEQGELTRYADGTHTGTITLRVRE